MELVRGGDLREQLDQGRRLTFDRSMVIMKELLSALSFAHEQGIIHRDVKPANVMLDSNGRAKLGDFGVARITDGGVATRTQGSMVGTLKYMSPEQVIGAKVDTRTDLFAAGVPAWRGTSHSCHDFLSAAFSFSRKGSMLNCHWSQMTSISALLAMALSVMCGTRS